MCQRSPGPRCASHARKAVQAAAKELKKLETEGAETKEINKAKKALASAVKIYDSTPTGQKKLEEQINAARAAKEPTRALSNRLSAGKKLREEQANALAAVIREEQAAEYRARKLEEMKEETLNAPPNPYKTAVSNYVLREGQFLKSGYWGGPTTDYEADEHLTSCGVAHTGNVQEEFSWQTYDSFTTTDHVGFAMDTTCNCGQIFQEPRIVKDKSMTDIMMGILND